MRIHSPDQGEERVFQTEGTEPEAALGQTGAERWRNGKKSLWPKLHKQASGEVGQAGRVWQPCAGSSCSSTAIGHHLSKQAGTGTALG